MVGIIAMAIVPIIITITVKINKQKIRMAGIPEDDEMLPSCVEDVTASIDLDGDGDITKEEFVRNALKNDFISKLLKYESNLP